MPLVRFITGLLALGLASTAVHGQTYPVKPVRLVTVAPGSANDLVARLIADELKTPFAQPVVVDNRGTIAAEVVAKAPPDGYTLLLYGSAVSISPFIHRSEAHSPLKDLLPITLVASRTTPDEFAAIIKAETAKWSKLIRDARIAAE